MDVLGQREYKLQISGARKYYINMSTEQVNNDFMKNLEKDCSSGICPNLALVLNGLMVHYLTGSC